MATMNMNTRSIILKSFTTKVSYLSPSSHLSQSLIRSLEDTREEDLTHPEDIAHFKKHDEMDAQADYQEKIDKTPINEQNIPQKFRRY